MPSPTWRLALLVATAAATAAGRSDFDVETRSVEPAWADYAVSAAELHGEPRPRHAEGRRLAAQSPPYPLLTISCLLLGYLGVKRIHSRLTSPGASNNKSYAMNMVSSTFSVYLADTLNTTVWITTTFAWNAAFNVGQGQQAPGQPMHVPHVVQHMQANQTLGNQTLWNQTLGNQTQASAGLPTFDWGAIIRSNAMFLGWIVVSGLVARFLRSQQHSHVLMTITEILGKITAFAGTTAAICSWGHCTGRDMWLVGIGMFVVLSLVRLGTHGVRSALGALDKPSAGQSMMMQIGAGPIDQWKTAALQAEDQACNIVSSFVVSELFMKTAFSGAQHNVAVLDWKGVTMLATSVGTCYGGVVVTTILIGLLPNSLPILSRMLNNVRDTCAKSTSWLVYRLCFAIAGLKLSGYSIGFIEIVTALILTSLSIVASKLVDVIGLALGVFDNPLLKVPIEILGGVAGEVGSCSCLSGRDKGAVLGGTPLSMLTGASKSFEKALNFDLALSSVVSSFALAVGLSWEAAMKAATAAVIAALPIQQLKQYEAMVKTAVGLASFVCMLPVWFRKIAPQAHQNVTNIRGVLDQGTQTVMRLMPMPF